MAGGARSYPDNSRDLAFSLVVNDDRLVVPGPCGGDVRLPYILRQLPAPCGRTII